MSATTSTSTSTRKRTLLGVWAHPDDETFMSAGLILDHVARGDRVVIVTATLGDHGTDDPRHWPPARLAARRSHELRRSMAVLGVDEIHVLGFEDGDCLSGDGTEAISGHIDIIRPDRIVTFGPEGMTGHPDHIAVSRWATDAWRSSASDAELWYATVTPDFHDRWDVVNDRVGFWYPNCERPSTPIDDLSHRIELTGERAHTKLAALRAHRSQTERIERLIGERAMREWWSIESFRAAPQPAEITDPRQRYHFAVSASPRAL